MATTRDAVRLAVTSAEERKAQNIVALDLRGLSTVTDYFIVCSGTSDTHVRAIAEGIRDALEKKGQKTFSFEGYQEGTWVLLDFVDFVVHVFHQEKRLFYGIEDLWADAKQLGFRAAAKPARATAAKTAKTAKTAAASKARKAAKPARAAKAAAAGKAKAPAARVGKAGATKAGGKAAPKAAAKKPAARKRTT